MTSRWILLSLPLILAAPGCVSQKMSEPKRTATEQLLISTATDRSLAQLNIDFLQGRKVYLDTTYFESLDQQYVIGSLRDMLFSRGLLLMPAMDQADIILEARSGALSINSSESLTGLPSMPLPVPFTGTLETPEIAAYKSQKQNSIARFSLLAYERDSREHLASYGPGDGTAYNNFYQLLGFIKFRRTDVPELKERLLKR